VVSFRGRESEQVFFYRLFLSLLPLETQISNRGGQAVKQRHDNIYRNRDHSDRIVAGLVTT
jgi:hypothetical protein